VIVNYLLALKPDVLFLRPDGVERKEVEALVENSTDSAVNLFLLAKCGEKVVGTLTFSGYPRLENRHCGEFGISVHPDCRRKGVGSSLIEEMEKWAIAHNYRKIELQVWSNNTPAVMMYRGNICSGIFQEMWNGFIPFDK
jgi:ribosomal protein S18 acetylase RimI-like enzyme